MVMPYSRSRRAVKSSAGSADAGAIALLDSSGIIDESMLPTPQEFAGTTWPSSPSDGQLYFKTDLAQPELFFWSDGNSAWLSVNQIEYVFTRATASGGAAYLQVVSAGTATEGAIDFGYHVNHDVLVESVSFASNAVAASDFDYIIRDDGVSTAAEIEHSTTTSAGFAEIGSPPTITAGSIMGCLAAAAVPGKIIVIAHARRKVTP